MVLHSLTPERDTYGGSNKWAMVPLRQTATWLVPLHRDPRRRKGSSKDSQQQLESESSASARVERGRDSNRAQGRERDWTRRWGRGSREGVEAGSKGW
eukprot:966112-Rhodomonas_salina.1